MMRIAIFLISTFVSAEIVAAQQEWTSWSSCTVTCGGGSQSRYFFCATPNASLPCGTFEFDNNNCNNNSCPINGGVGAWADWSPCSTSCGAGSSQRRRLCDSPAPQHGGDNCSEALTEDRDCSIAPCPIDGGWGPWDNWTDCSVSCGGGLQQRSRQCDSPAPQYNGSDCVGATSEEASCNIFSCPIDGGPGAWGNWSACSVTCGGGSRSRSRDCDNPAPQFGGMNCSLDDLSEADNCSSNPCPIDGGVGSWEPWGPCSTSCGNGTKRRERRCDSPAPQYNGSSCAEHLNEDTSCDLGPCPIDGGVGTWGNWSECSTTCGGGLRQRSRLCDNPAPAHNGSQCAQDLTEVLRCSEDPCPVDGGVGAWTEWTACSATCGESSRQRTRLCDSPAPAHNGSDCQEALTQTEDQCSIPNCPIDGGVGAWGNWSDCSATCGGGVISRERLCDNPVPANNGSDCTEDLTESQVCSNQTCPPVDGGVGPWTNWSACSATCGDGVWTRSRQCDSPAPAHNGSQCSAPLSQTQACSEIACGDNVRDNAAGGLASSLITLLAAAFFTVFS